MRGLSIRPVRPAGVRTLREQSRRSLAWPYRLVCRRDPRRGGEPKLPALLRRPEHPKVKVGPVGPTRALPWPEPSLGLSAMKEITRQIAGKYHPIAAARGQLTVPLAFQDFMP